MEDNDDDEDANKVQIPVKSTTTANQPPPFVPSAIMNPPPEFYAQLIETMKNIQAPNRGQIQGLRGHHQPYQATKWNATTNVCHR